MVDFDADGMVFEVAKYSDVVCQPGTPERPWGKGVGLSKRAFEPYLYLIRTN